MRALVLAVLVVLGASACDIATIAGRNARLLFTSPSAPTRRAARPGRADAKVAAVFVGHATFVIQIEDRFVLTDPVFTSTVGGLQRRIVEPGLDPKDLPPLDAVLISHLHMDHLSLGSLDQVAHAVRRVVVPTGGAVYVPNERFTVHELDTWEATDIGGLRVTAVPVDHSGFRYGADGAWLEHAYTGYVVEYRGTTIWFGGDTAYAKEAFVETRRHFPNIDVAFMPIAPILPRSLMQITHVDPEEAVQAFLDLGAHLFVPMHYGTFLQGAEPAEEPLRQLERIARRRLPEGAVAIVGIGEERILIPRTK